jgi:integral membrane sensor domain MASE1
MNSDIPNKAGTKLSRNAMVLAIWMIVNVVIIILLTPLGFETRRISELKPLGYVAITTIFVGLALDLTSIVLLLFKRARVRLASSLVIVSSVLFFLIISVDRTGSFFSVPTPPAINTLEYILTAVLIVNLVIASVVYRKSKPA